MKKKTTVLITGPLPPPAGGISIHIWRLKYLLEKDFNLDFIDEASEKKAGFFNIKSFQPFTYFKKIAQSDLLFIHSGNRILKKLHITLAKLFGKKIILTLHGYGAKRKMPFRAIDSAFFNLAHKIILVNEDIYQKLSLPLSKCIVKHAFLPPVMAEEPPLPNQLAHFIEAAKKNKRTIICANASRLDVHKNEDLYGLDMCIEVTKRLLAKGSSICFVFTVSSIDSGADKLNQAKQLIKTLGIEDRFLLLQEKISFVRLIENADIVVRPTNTDGDALTIREALFLDKKVLASDVTSRPIGTQLFATRNIEDFENKLEALLYHENGMTGVQESSNTSAPENFSLFYKDLINEVAR